MLVGAWGAQPGDLLERVAKPRGEQLHRVGRLTMLTPPDIVAGSWQCWLFGEPEARDMLATRFGQQASNELAGVFGRALVQLGEDACELLYGRFVVVAFNIEQGRCTITRDQLGAHPLIHTRAGDGVLFAEHERDLLDRLPATPNPDRLALLQWIENGISPAGRTLYEGLCHVPAGHRLLLGDGRGGVERWWTLRYQGTESGTARELGELLRDSAFAAIGQAAAGSQRVAVKLSGGLDSACVAAGLAANGFADGRAMAISGAFSDYPATDESELIRATARHTRLPLELVPFNSEHSMLAPSLEHIARWRIPPATPNQYLWRPLIARARELGVKLMLDGEGGDELFGLEPYLIADMLRTGRLRSAWSLTAGIPGMGLDPDKRVRLRVLRHYGLRPLLPRSIRRLRDRRSVATSSGSLVPRADALALIDLLTAAEEDRDGPLWWRRRAEILVDMRDMLDMGGHFRREALDEGIAWRHPLLYHLPTTETALRLPPRPQFDPVRDRPLLRDALSGLIPEQVRTRHAKSHFSPLVLAGMRADESRLIEPMRRTDAPVRAYVAPDALERHLAVAPDDRSMLAAGSLWRVAIANSWLDLQGTAHQQLR
jgi:asparagine synthase (glutamine-hydrolysing)